MKWSTTFSLVLLLLTLGIIFTPRSDKDHSTDGGSGGGSYSKYKDFIYLSLNTVHLLSFASALGTSLWVTFIGGIIMFRNLPRHQFGRLQGKLFPAYFILVSVTSTICLSVFSFLHPLHSASSTDKSQYFALSTTLLFSLLNIAVLEPKTSQVMKARQKVEREEGIGDEIGLSKNMEVAKKSESLRQLNRKFGMYHGLASLANLFSLGGIIVHSCYLGGRLQI